ncbi:carboxypeptidase regulatory-like domain-containing protein [Blastopirellula sp. J2-11]|uniref:carboxypeptidase regulatory-like domain-containing protein n=1 Tax=Blastopirellula sp. J2-11 TaxID=2943192 RepID=UPI0021C8BE57|nr:carboxypeptidase regulatory-like domain-containing protein [Blastopirellula sp. J2-11]UUO06547.1 carboxypeptidase regulatory-like domain-containing protein [Blastopirellula sp. J2-11]
MQLKFLSSQSHTLSTLLALLAVSLAVGCSNSSGPELGYVEGVVTFDGKSLEYAEIQFEPLNGRPSLGISDSNGHYALRFTGTRNGATLGKHVVRIISARDSSGGEGNQPFVKSRPEILPAKYHINSELTAEVQSGNNTINFDLTSN